MTDVEQLARQHGITAAVVRADDNPNMVREGWDARHYRVTLRCDGRRLTVPFSQGLGIPHPPTVGDVLECLASDASSYDSANGFEDWAENLGMDPDSRKAERIYRAVERQTRGLRRLVSDVAYTELTEGDY